MAKASEEKFLTAFEGIADIASNDQIIAHFLDMCGGARAFAKELHKQFISPSTTPMVKARIMEMLLRCLKFAEQNRPKFDDLGMLSEDDLEVMARKMAQKLPINA